MKAFLNQLDHDRIVTAIGRAEEKTAGEIRVRITHRKTLLFGDEMHFARRAFHKMGMAKTPEHHAVLLVIFPRRRKIVVLGDHTVHEKFGQTFWEQIVEEATRHFKTGHYTQGILRAIEGVGQALSHHFPKTTAAAGSLPNEVVED